MEFRWESAKLQKACPWSCGCVSLSLPLWSLETGNSRVPARVRTNLKAASLSAPDFESRLVRGTADALRQRTEDSGCCKNTNAWRNATPWPWNHPLVPWSSFSLVLLLLVLVHHIVLSCFSLSLFLLPPVLSFTFAATWIIPTESVHSFASRIESRTSSYPRF